MNAKRWLKRGLLVVAGLLLFLLGVVGISAGFFHPYRIPSSAMEPTLHCARPAPGCEAGNGDRIFVPRFTPFWTPSRGDIVVFNTPPEAAVKCGAGGTFVKRLIGLPGETIKEKSGSISIDGKPLKEPYIERDNRGSETRTWEVPEGEYLDRKSTRLNSSHIKKSRMPSSA